MKLRRIVVEPNDDGTFQVNCEFSKDNGQWYDGGDMRYAAKSIDDIIPKIKMAQKKASGLKAGKKKNGTNRSVEEFVKT